ncbi:tyrosine-type recombinase/integrase [Anaerotruncus massiliensis (ex Liu et al. 2021)]|uniref:tyrosine-type recombinase/integrase n=1 Tax=Anaerotruncus massiliensis (ex Liu et al. 2021) TaxID=2321404 RepID=UPI003AB65508
MQPTRAQQQGDDIVPRPKKELPNHAGGLYEVKITTGKTIDGKLIRKSFYSSISKEDARRQADQWKIAREVSNQTGVSFVEKDITFGEWALKWAEVYKRPNVDSATYITTYLNTITKHLNPYFGQAALKDIKQVDIVNFYSSKKDYSESMLDKMQMCLKSIFDAAIDNDLCYKNPAKRVSPTSAREKNIKKVYTDDQIDFVEQYAKGTMPEVILLIETGVRRGELIGMEWDDIDLEAETNSVNRSVADKKGGGVKINPPKHKSYRTNPLTDRALDVLKSLPRTSRYVFPSKSGGPQSPNSWSRKLDRFMRKLARDNPAIPMLTAHELRHTCGTRMRRNGTDIYSIQKFMGHKDVNVTAEIYVHNEIEPLRKAIKERL